MSGPPTGQDLADWMRLPAVDDLCEECIQAAVEWVESYFCNTDPVILWTVAKAGVAAKQYGAFHYQKRSAPAGLPEYDEFQSQLGSSMSEIQRLLGAADPVIA